jgi:hypothetical protein
MENIRNEAVESQFDLYCFGSFMEILEKPWKCSDMISLDLPIKNTSYGSQNSD